MNGMDHAPEVSHRGRGGIAGEILPGVDALPLGAARNDDAELGRLVEDADFTGSDFADGAHDRLANIARSVRHAETVLGLGGSLLRASLADSGLTPEKFDVLSTKVSHDGGKPGATRGAIGGRSVATAGILALMASIREHFGTKLVPVAGTFFRGPFPT